ncbi:MAG: TfoX/Sxy family protein [Anaerolineales bacterium]|nr:TfoX/Sxy family protein [Anaerolineales bacterium]
MALDEMYRNEVMGQLELVLPDVHDRKMFGGLGIYSETWFFALITSGNVLHFKVDDSSRAEYEARGMPRFEHMSYYRVPDEVLGDLEQLRGWAETAVSVAKRSRKKGK